MTNEYKLKQNTSTKEFAKKLYDFTLGFYTESIGICVKECEDCKDDCIGCIAEWLQKESD